MAIDVAIALPVSWKPFVKSNASAVATSSTKITSSALMALILLTRRVIHPGNGDLDPFINQAIFGSSDTSVGRLLI